jgi:hypothetical protein
MSQTGDASASRSGAVDRVKRHAPRVPVETVDDVPESRAVTDDDAEDGG